MARPYSLDLRVRVVAAVDAGLPRVEVMRLFGVGRSTVRRLLKARRERASLEPKPGGGRRPGQLAAPAAQTLLRAQLAADGDARIEDHRRRWREAGGPMVSTSTLWRALRALGWTHKKSGSPPASVTSRSVRAGEKKAGSARTRPPAFWPRAGSGTFTRPGMPGKSPVRTTNWRC